MKDVVVPGKAWQPQAMGGILTWAPVITHFLLGELHAPMPKMENRKIMEVDTAQCGVTPTRKHKQGIKNYFQFIKNENCRALSIVEQCTTVYSRAL